MLIESVGVLGGDEIHGLERRKTKVWGLSLDEFDEYDADGPDVNKLVVEILVDELWGHPCRSADNGLSFLLLFGELNSEAKISNLNITILINQDIVTLKITMNLFLVMNKI